MSLCDYVMSEYVAKTFIETSDVQYTEYISYHLYHDINGGDIIFLYCDN